MISQDIILQTIGKDKNGNSILETDDFDTFLESLTAIPKEKNMKKSHIKDDVNGKLFI